MSKLLETQSRRWREGKEGWGGEDNHTTLCQSKKILDQEDPRGQAQSDHGNIRNRSCEANIFSYSFVTSSTPFNFVVLLCTWMHEKFTIE